MPQRNGQNPIRAAVNFEHASASKETGATHGPAGSAGIPCPSCKTLVPPKPGFRVSSLKCPKCGSSMGKK